MSGSVSFAAAASAPVLPPGSAGAPGWSIFSVTSMRPPAATVSFPLTFSGGGVARIRPPADVQTKIAAGWSCWRKQIRSHPELPGERLYAFDKERKELVDR